MRATHNIVVELFCGLCRRVAFICSGSKDVKSCLTRCRVTSKIGAGDGFWMPCLAIMQPIKLLVPPMQFLMSHLRGGHIQQGVLEGSPKSKSGNAPVAHSVFNTPERIIQVRPFSDLQNLLGHAPRCAMSM